MKVGAGANRRGILRPQGTEGSFQLSRYAPSEDLAFFVERFWFVRWDRRGKDPHYQEILPHPHVNVVLQKGASGAYGISLRRFSIVLEGKGQVLGMKLRAGAFAPFVDFSMSAMIERIVPMTELFGPESEALERDVLAIEDDPAQIALYEAFLRPRLPARDENIDTVARIVKIALDPNVTRASDLASRSGMPMRALQRLFQRYLGVGPKWVLRRARVHEAAERVGAGGRIDWAALAAELGYTDQAHFIRDFKAQIGKTPVEYAASCALRE